MSEQALESALIDWDVMRAERDEARTELIEHLDGCHRTAVDAGRLRRELEMLRREIEGAKRSLAMLPTLQEYCEHECWRCEHERDAIAADDAECYAARANDGLVKIGSSRSALLRVAQLSAEYGRLEILGIRPSPLGRLTERRIHRELAPLRCPRPRGQGKTEWFKDGSKLREVIAKHGLVREA